MAVTIELQNPKIVAQRSEMLRAMLIYDSTSKNELCFSEGTILFLNELCQNALGSITTEDIERYLTGFILALDLCSEVKDIGAMLDSFFASTLATYFCCNEEVMNSCMNRIQKDHHWFRERCMPFNELVMGNIDQLMDSVTTYRNSRRCTKKKNLNKSLCAKKVTIPGWEKRQLRPVLRPGDQLIL